MSEYIYSEDKEDYFLFLGKLDWAAKGLLFAVKIAMEMKLKLVLAGDFLDPTNYEKQIKGLLTEDINYIGPVGGGDKAELLSKAKGLFFPVIWPEPFGLVVPEALASGTPVIASGEGAMPEIIKDGETGFVCKNIQEMKDAVLNIDRISPRKCRDHVEKNFTSARMCSDYLDLYKQIIEKQRIVK